MPLTLDLLCLQEQAWNMGNVQADSKQGQGHVLLLLKPEQFLILLSLTSYGFHLGLV